MIMGPKEFLHRFKSKLGRPGSRWKGLDLRRHSLEDPRKLGCQSAGTAVKEHCGQPDRGSMGYLWQGHRGGTAQPFVTHRRTLLSVAMRHGTIEFNISSLHFSLALVSPSLPHSFILNEEYVLCPWYPGYMYHMF